MSEWVWYTLWLIIIQFPAVGSLLGSKGVPEHFDGVAMNFQSTASNCYRRQVLSVIQQNEDEIDMMNPVVKHLATKITRRLGDSQQQILVELCRLLDIYLNLHPYPERNNDALYSWDAETWLNTCYRLAASVHNRPNNLSLDCWLSNFKLDKDNYPSLKITPVQLSRKSNQGTRLFNIGGAPSKRAKAFKVTTALANPALLTVLQSRDHNSQTAHLCSSVPPACINPHHMLPCASDKLNKEMHKCVRSLAMLCPGHGENNTKCIYTDSNGRWLPCRNMELTSTRFEVVCTHTPSCFFDQ